MISKKDLNYMYAERGMSMKQISGSMNCSVHKVEYWMKKHNIQRRSISDAVYTRNNPKGDPFNVIAPKTIDDAILYGIGMGLYWGEGNKASKTSVRLGNTDPELMNTFVRFLTDICGVDKERLKFGLQIFSDTNPAHAKSFWIEKLEVKESQFYKVTVTISGKIGTYRKKNKYGVVTVYFNNRKLRDILINMLPR